MVYQSNCSHKFFVAYATSRISKTHVDAVPSFFYNVLLKFTPKIPGNNQITPKNIINNYYKKKRVGNSRCYM